MPLTTAECAKPCQQGPWATQNSGPRKASSIDLIVIHSAEGTSALGVANWFARPNATASTQLAVDNVRCVRMLGDLKIPWGASGANHDGLHVEMCGYARWSRDEWLARDKMLRRGAYKCAMWCWLYDIPAKRLTVADLRAGRRGFTTHLDVNRAFKKGDHHDPGPGFPHDVFMRYVRSYLAGIQRERGA